MNKILFILALVLGISLQVAHAQTPKLKVGSNPTSLNSSAVLEVQSTTQGFLPPRMTINQITAITTPVEGLSVYCIDCTPKALLSFDGVNWVNANGQTPVAPPSAPTDPVATAGVGSASVAFAAPVTSGSAPIVNYTVTCFPGGFTTVGTSSPIVIRNLTSGTAYKFTVRASNGSGLSATSVFSNSVTPTAGVPDAPTAVTATSTLSQTASVAFTAPTNTGGTAITGYSVTSTPGGFTATGTTSPLVVSGLTNGTAYTFTVVATNAQGNSVASSPSNALTPQATVPGRPVIGTATISATTASVAFTAPTNNGGSTITGYTVVSNPGAIVATGTASPISVPGLTPGVAYTFTVAATNEMGTSAASSASNVVTAFGLPSAPSGVGAVVLGRSDALISFLPANANGSPITKYSITGTPALTPTTYNASSSPITINNLAAGTTYTISITATNAAGTSLPSNTVTFTADNQVPYAPTQVIAIAGNAQAAVVFTPSASNGGSAITGYTVISNPGGFTATGTSSPLTVTGLTNGTSYTFTVVATNAIGNSVPSGVSNTIIPYNSSSFVFSPVLTQTGLTSVAAYSSRKINSSYFGPAMKVRRSSDNLEQDINFTASGLLDETALTAFVGTTAASQGYVTVWYDQSGNGRHVTQATQTKQPLIITNGVLNKIGTRPAIRFNGGLNGQLLFSGENPFSNPGIATVSIVHTEIVRNDNTGFSLAATRTWIADRYSSHLTWNDGVIRVDWGGKRTEANRTVSIGTPLAMTFTSNNIQNFSQIRFNGLQRKANYDMPTGQLLPTNQISIGGDLTADQSFNGTIAEFILLPTVPSNSVLEAFEANQVGHYGLSMTGLNTNSILAPSAPTSVTATAGNAVANVNFLNVNGATSYTVTSNPGGITVMGTSSPVQVMGLTNGTAYTFTVVANNNNLSSAPSVASNAVTPSLAASGQTIPNQPIMSPAIAGNLSATVSFSAPANTGNSVITGYRVTSNPGGIIATGAASPITVPGLVANTSYTFTVTATNSEGTSIPSAISNAVIPFTVPSKPVLSSPQVYGLAASFSITANNNSSPITQYTATINPGNIQVTSSFNPMVISFDAPGTYSVSVTATNAAGTSVASNTVNVTISPLTTTVNAINVGILNAAGQPFNANPIINENTLISVGVNCPPSVTWQGVLYPTVNIQGQCWMKQDFRGIPSNYASITPTSWLNATIADIGSWGFANVLTQDGSAGWATSPQTSTPDVEGYLYQWSAAMNGQTAERAQGACPTGWHVPSAVEFYYLMHIFGATTAQQVFEVYFTPSDYGNIQRTYGASTYTFRFPNGMFKIRNYVGTWMWSSTPNSSDATKASSIDFENTNMGTGFETKNHGFKLRCLKD